MVSVTFVVDMNAFLHVIFLLEIKLIRQKTKNEIAQRRKYSAHINSTLY